MSAVSPATRELTRLQARELLRDRRYFIFALLFPFGMLAIFLVINAMMPKGSGGPDFTKTVVPMALFLAITGAALTVTAGPLAGMRERGLLRLLSTTPVGRRRLLLTHLAVRVAMVTVQAAALLVIALAIGALSLADLPAMLGVTALGMALFLSIGALVGGRLRSADLAANVGTLVQLGTLFLSGLAIPLWLLPDAVAQTLSWLPSTFLADLYLRQMPGTEPFHPAWLGVVVIVATTGLVLALAVRTFRWDSGED